ncbi:MAG: hypothetical protein ACKVS5_08195 [Parvularculaceae bacterium]
MILRRITEHVKAQNWFAVAIDFVIVVAGVFVGIQVSNWNAGQFDQARAESYSARLTADLRYEAWHNEYLIAYYKEVLENAERATAALTGAPALADEQFLTSAYRASQYLYYGTRRATYDELVATGDISLIADARLRETAVTYYNDPTIAFATAESRSSEFRRAFRRAVPAAVQHALLERCGDKFVEPGDFAGIVGTLDYPCTLDLPAEDIASAAAAIRMDADLLKSLQLRFADLETNIVNLESANPQMLADLRAIAKEGRP